MVVWAGVPFGQVVDKAALSSWFPHTLFGVSSVITEESPKEPRRNSEETHYLVRPRRQLGAALVMLVIC